MGGYNQHYESILLILYDVLTGIFSGNKRINVMGFNGMLIYVDGILIDNEIQWMVSILFDDPN